MTDVFADTSFFVALVSSADKHHVVARRFSRDRQERLVTTAWVGVELANFLSRPALRPAFLNLWSSLRNDNSSLVLPAQQEQFDMGAELFANRPDKEWSLTDCISMEVMRTMGIDSVLTADRHFLQAGFRALLLEQS